MEDADFALALQLQEQFDAENAAVQNNSDLEIVSSVIPSTAGLNTRTARLSIDSVNQSTEENGSIDRPLSLVDKAWELIDPSPDVRALFMEFNKKYFWGKLDCIEVRWSPRMTLCAGVCVYEGRGGLCSVRLSEPLLKLRPRSDLVETLLHEMIHAYLFVTDGDRDRDGHGPNFCKHMQRLNKITGANITIYHSFHDEVDNYRQHWWRCDGSCRSRKPYFGYVKRAMNRAPSSRDLWWEEHQRTCGGTYHKIKEPEGYGKKNGNKEKSAAATTAAAALTGGASGVNKDRNVNGILTNWLKTNTNPSNNVSGSDSQSRILDLCDGGDYIDDDDFPDVEFASALDAIGMSFTKNLNASSPICSKTEILRKHSESLELNNSISDNWNNISGLICKNEASTPKAGEKFLSKALVSAGKVLKEPTGNENISVGNHQSSNLHTSTLLESENSHAFKKTQEMKTPNGSVLRKASSFSGQERLTPKDLALQKLNSSKVPVGSYVVLKNFISVCSPVHRKPSKNQPISPPSDPERNKRSAQGSECAVSGAKRQRLDSKVTSATSATGLFTDLKNSTAYSSFTGERANSFSDELMFRGSTGKGISSGMSANSVNSDNVDVSPAGAGAVIDQVCIDNVAAMGGNDLVSCPVCQLHVNQSAINEHLDLCLGSS